MKLTLVFAVVLLVGCAAEPEDKFRAGMERAGYQYVDATRSLVESIFQEPEIDSLWKISNRPSISFGTFHAHDAMTLGHGIKFNTNKLYTREQMRDIIKFQLGILYAYSRADQ